MATMADGPSAVKEAFDTEALNGLRGLAAIHICIFHSLLYSEAKINIFGQVHMPLFMILSGFSLTLGYGKKKFRRAPACCGQNHVETDCTDKECESKSQDNVFKSLPFYINRLNRILPVYYATFIFGLPIICAGTSYFGPFDWFHNIGGAACAFFGVQTWVIIFGFGPIGPSWFISTLLFFYLLYPRLLVIAQRQSSRRLFVWIPLLFYLQAFLGLVSAGLAKSLLPMIIEMAPYWLSTAHPLTRLPVFCMGICSGVLYMRIKEGDLVLLDGFGHRNENCFISFVEDNFFPIPCGKRYSCANSIDVTTKQRSWARRTNINCLWYFSLLIILSVLSSTTGQTWLDIPPMMLQWFAVNTQLRLVIGLCLDSGSSIPSRFFNSKMMQFLGRISMSFYLSHEVIIFWLKWMIYGMFNWPYEILTYQEKLAQASVYAPLPMWAVPIHIGTSILLGIVLTILLEEPARKWLRQEGKQRRNWLVFFATVITIVGAVVLTLGFLFHGGNVISEEKFTVQGNNFNFQKILSGTSKLHADMICKGRGMKVFEPKDGVINNQVWEEMSKRTNYPFWINIKRDNIHQKVFKYGSDNETIVWANWQRKNLKHSNDPRSNQTYDCVGMNFQSVSKYGLKIDPSKKHNDTWYRVNCHDRLAVVCQDE